MVYDGVPLTLIPDAVNPDAFTIKVEGRGLVWTPATDTAPRHADVVVVASTFDKKNKELKRIAKVISANATADVPPTGPIQRDLNLKFPLEHDPKAVRVRFVVRVSATGRIGTVDAKLNQGPVATTKYFLRAARTIVRSRKGTASAVPTKPVALIGFGP